MPTHPEIGGRPVLIGDTVTHRLRPDHDFPRATTLVVGVHVSDGEPWIRVQDSAQDTARELPLRQVALHDPATRLAELRAELQARARRAAAALRPLGLHPGSVRPRDDDPRHGWAVRGWSAPSGDRGDQDWTTVFLTVDGDVVGGAASGELVPLAELTVAPWSWVPVPASFLDGISDGISELLTRHGVTAAPPGPPSAAAGVTGK